MIAASGQGQSNSWPVLSDMHCHLGFAIDPLRIADEAAKSGAALFSNSVTPKERRRLISALEGRAAGSGCLGIGAGLHPWYVSEGSAGRDIEMVEEDIAACSFVGEIGLDAGTRHVQNLDLQERVFTAALRAAANAGDRVLSIHAVRSAGRVLELLGQTNASAECACVFHWFSGTSDELQAAIRQGCLFSVNLHMLQTKRGREYAKAIPAQRLLLETDAPAHEGSDCTFVQLQRELGKCCDILAELRGPELALQANDNTKALIRSRTY